MSRYLGVVTSLVLAFLDTSTASGQTCRALDRDGTQFQYMMGTYSGANPGTPEAVTRDSLRLPAVPASQVTIVTTTTTCKKANTAYQSQLAGAGTGFSNQLYVLQIGTTYAVLDPAFYIGPPMNPHNWVIVILDSHFKVLSEM